MPDHMDDHKYLPSRNHVNGKPEAIVVKVGADGHAQAVLVDRYPSIDQEGPFFETREEAIAYAKKRWRR